MKVMAKFFQLNRTSLFPILLLHGLNILVIAQNCAVPRVVQISSNNPNLTETACQGSILATIPSHNIKSVQLIQSSGTTNYVNVEIIDKDLVLTLIKPLKNYLDDCKRKTIDFQALFECKDGRNKTVEFRIPFRDENTKVPRFYQKNYNTTMIFPWPRNFPLDIDVQIFDEDRDEENSLVCVEVTMSASALSIRASTFQTIRVLPQPEIMDIGAHTYHVMLYLEQYSGTFTELTQRGQLSIDSTFVYPFKLTTWNRHKDSECTYSPPEDVSLTNTANITLYVNLSDSVVTSIPIIPITKETTLPPSSPDFCNVIQFNSFYYKALVSLDYAIEGLELKNVEPFEISASSSIGLKIWYEILESDNFKIDPVDGRVYFQRNVSIFEIDEMQNHVEIVLIRAISWDEFGINSSAVVSLVVMYEIAEELPGTATPGDCTSRGTESQTECPICAPTDSTPTTRIPNCPTIPSCPACPSCPTPHPCSTALPELPETTYSKEEPSTQTEFPETTPSPTTKTTSTYVASTDIAATDVPTTENGNKPITLYVPTTNDPATNVPSTYVPTTDDPATNFPTTNSPATYDPWFPSQTTPKTTTTPVAVTGTSTTTQTTRTTTTTPPVTGTSTTTGTTTVPPVTGTSTTTPTTKSPTTTTTPTAAPTTTTIPTIIIPSSTPTTCTTDQESLPTSPTSPEYPFGICYNNSGHPFLNIIPDPTDCSAYLSCVPEDYGNGKPSNNPVQLRCNPKTPLQFNFMTCTCDYPQYLVCFDPIVHDQYRMRCACPLIQNSDRNWVPDPTHNRCPNGLQYASYKLSKRL